MAARKSTPKSGTGLREPTEDLPPKRWQKSVLAIADNAFLDGDRSAHFGNPEEKSAVRKLARAGYMTITLESKTELYAKMTVKGHLLLASLRRGP